MHRGASRFYRVYHLQVKTHKLTIMLSALQPGTTIAELKMEVLAALRSNVAQDSLDVMAMEPPQIDVRNEDDFELCQALKERGKPNGQYEVLPPSKAVRDFWFSGFDTIYLQFRDRATDELLPITYTRPPLYDDEEIIPQPRARSPEVPPTPNKGKRKADDIDEDTRPGNEQPPVPVPNPGMS